MAQMNGSGALGSDGVSMMFFKQCFNVSYVFAQVVLCIINTSLVTGVVPQSWKLAIIQPIYKSTGILTDPSNFRPISLVPCLAKIIERIVHKQLNSHLITNHLFASSQHGFRSQHSTQTALISVTDEILENMDHGSISLLVMLDLSKAFDVIPHDRLLGKLELYGVDTTWFESYLSDHRQKVRTYTQQGTQQLSDPISNPIGVYQGTSLGPLLFNIFTNDLSLYVGNDVTITQYADDTQVQVTGKKRDVAVLVSRMEYALAALLNWFTGNLMKLNADKTKLLVIGSWQMLRNLPPITLRVGGATISESTTAKKPRACIRSSSKFRSSHRPNHETLQWASDRAEPYQT